MQKLINIANIGALNIDIASSGNLADNNYGPDKRLKIKSCLATALKSLKEAEKLARDLDARQVLCEVYKNMSATYNLMNNFSKAYHYHVLYSELNDSLFSMEKTRTIMGLEEKYESEIRSRDEAEKARLMAEKINHRNFLQYLGICLGIFFLFLIAFLGRTFIVSKRLYEALVFMSFLLLFQFLSVFSDPYIENITLSVPLYKLLSNIFLAIVLTPIEETLERLVRTRKRRLVAS